MVAALASVSVMLAGSSNTATAPWGCSRGDYFADAGGALRQPRTWLVISLVNNWLAGFPSRYARFFIENLNAILRLAPFFAKSCRSIHTDAVRAAYIVAGGESRFFHLSIG